MRYWAFAANPTTYRIEHAVRELEFDYWTTGASRVRKGDRAIIWKTLADADGKRTVFRSYADSVPKKCGQCFEVMRTLLRFRRNGVRDGSGRCPHSVGGVSAFRRNRESLRVKGAEQKGP